MSPLPLRERRVASAVLLLARTVYAFNWYDIGAVPTPIERSFGIGTVEFGVVLGAFLVGAAIFQVPAGLAALRWGNRATSVAAVGAMGAFCLASGFAPSWTILALLRFGAGVSAAFFFAPALGLITSYYPEGRRGPIIGLYNGGFALGSAVGLIGGAVLAQSFGWASALASGGVLLLVALVPMVLVLPASPRTEAPAGWRTVVRAAAPIVRSRRLWALTLAGAGLWAGYYIAAQYFVQFAGTAHPSWSLAVAASVPTAMILTELPSGPLGGWFAERARDMRRPFLLWGLVAAALLCALPFLSFAWIWPAFVALGFAAGITWAVLYVVPTYLPELRGEGLSFGVGLLNSVQIFVGSALTIVFALIASSEGFTLGWWFAGAVSAAFLPALIGVGRVARGSPTLSEGARTAEREPTAR